MRLFASAGEELEAASMQGARSLIWQARAAQAFHWAGEHHRAMRLLRRQGESQLLPGSGPVLGGTAGNALSTGCHATTSDLRL